MMEWIPYIQRRISLPPTEDDLLLLSLSILAIPPEFAFKLLCVSQFHLRFKSPFSNHCIIILFKFVGALSEYLSICTNHWSRETLIQINQNTIRYFGHYQFIRRNLIKRLCLAGQQLHCSSLESFTCARSNNRQGLKNRLHRSTIGTCRRTILVTRSIHLVNSKPPINHSDERSCGTSSTSHA